MTRNIHCRVKTIIYFIEKHWNKPLKYSKTEDETVAKHRNIHLPMNKRHFFKRRWSIILIIHIKDQCSQRMDINLFTT